MGISHAEFFRTLPAALAGRPHQITGNRVLVREGERRIVIHLSPQRERAIGALRLPKTDVRFSFTGYPRQAIEDFMAYFNSRFQRGGG